MKSLALALLRYECYECYELTMYQFILQFITKGEFD